MYVCMHECIIHKNMMYKLYVFNYIFTKLNFFLFFKWFHKGVQAPLALPLDPPLVLWYKSHVNVTQCCRISHE